jgi:DNA-binding LacI/PurR family transcriptional regulator/DNA-binding transcriptional regulator YhcF (GntR family)
MTGIVKAKEPKRQLLYRAVVDDLKRQIDNHVLLPGDRLPSIVELADQQNVSTITVRSAISELIKMGYVASRPRLGIFVNLESARQQRAPRRPTTDRIHFAGGPGTQTLSGIIVGLIAVAPSPDPTDLNRWSHFNHLRIAIVRGAEQAIGEAGGTARFTGIDDWTQISDHFAPAIQSHIKSGASAIVVIDIHNHPGLAEQVMRTIEQCPVPIIYVSSGETCHPPFHVYCDNKASGLMAANHLLKQGYSDIIFVGPLDSTWVTERSEGVARAVETAGAPSRFRELPKQSQRLPDDLVNGNSNAERLKLIKFAVDQLTGWPGIVAANDDAATAIYQIQKFKGLTAGLDYGLIGFDDEPQVRALGISSLFPVFSIMGQQAVQLVANVLHGHISNAVVRLPPVLFPRESTLARPNDPLPRQT